jgi:hypothetical protein
MGSEISVFFFEERKGLFEFLRIKIGGTKFRLLLIQDHYSALNQEQL